MPLLLSSTARCLSGTAAHTSDSRHAKGDIKGVLSSLLRGKPAGTAFCSSGSPSNHSLLSRLRCTALPSHNEAAQQAAADGTVPAATASTAAADAAATATADAHWEQEALRLMTAAQILSSSPSSSSTDDITPTASLDDALDDDSSILSRTSALSSSSLTSLTMPAHADAGEGGLENTALEGPLSVLGEIQTLDADSLSLTVGILRQRQPLGAEEGEVQLSERLRDFLLVLRRRPGGVGASSLSGSTPAHSTISPHSTPGSSTPAAAAAGSSGGAAEDGFWAGQDEWADVRSALMGIGINASLDEEEDDEEGVWALEAGLVKTRRTRLLRSLPKLDSSTARQLTAFLAEVQQHSSSSSSMAPPDNTPAAAAAAANSGAGASTGEQEEEEQWWQQVALAYSLLKQQAGRVQEQGQDQDQQQQEQTHTVSQQQQLEAVQQQLEAVQQQQQQ